MGLDFGINMKTHKPIKSDPTVAELLMEPLDKYGYPNTYECMYFRKCWNVRRDVLAVTHAAEHGYDGTGGDYEITLDELIAVKDLLVDYLYNANPEEWEDETIWGWNKESVNTIASQIVTLELMIRYMAEHRDVEVYVYDSY